MNFKEYSPVLDLQQNNEWIFKSNILYYDNQIIKTPMLEIYKEDTIFLYLDLKNSRRVISLIKILKESPFDFYLVCPNFNDPKVKRSNWVNLSIKSYFDSFINNTMFLAYKDLDWDPIKNLIKFTKIFGNNQILLECYNRNKELVNKQSHDWTTGEYKYNYDEEVRDFYNSLYRDIQLQMILE